MGKRLKPDPIRSEHRLVFLGPPGSGKGTQARLLAKRHGFSHISTGVLLRREIRAHTDLGIEAQRYIKEGRLAPDHIVRQLAEDAIAEENFQGFILDGYPRTIQQAHWLCEFLGANSVSLTSVVNLEIDDEDVISRLSQRRIHSRTGENFHLSNKPPPQEESKFIITRQDDQPDAIRKRLKVYYQLTHPLINHYAAQNILFAIQAVGSFSEVQSQICAHLGLDQVLAE